MTNIQMPEPVAWWIFDARSGNSELATVEPHYLPEGVVAGALCLVNEAEAYADARVRKALEEVMQIMRSYDGSKCTGMAHHASERIRALIPEPPCDT